ncbi:MAG TPA: imidazole glycerol phosphate synthase subunit HisH [Candidatus Coprenecus pullistercoris]|nr:imidazole glycerol phosphate synthase subunit HisH [Candidatus Coprenecus pullistercoris]
MTGIIDYDTGNIRSVENALRRLGAEYVLSSDKRVLDACERLILPGVGEAAWAMSRLRERGLDAFIRSCTKPVFGICLGMQLLCAWSEEGDAECLGIFPNRVRNFRRSIAEDRGLKIPQVGWNDIRSLEPELFLGVPEGAYMYFVHSYFAEVNEYTASVTEYGPPFSSSLRKGNFMGCQFHPEKSGDDGEKILYNFLKMKL